jgi:hypothetical protein
MAHPQPQPAALRIGRLQLAGMREADERFLAQ